MSPKFRKQVTVAFFSPVRYDITQKGESFKLTIKGAKPTDEAEYKLQIGERPTKSVVTVQERE